MHRRRHSITILAALALALTVSLSGCATIFGTSPQSGAPAVHSKAPTKTGLTGKAARHAPKVGSCWHGEDPHGAPQLGWYLADDSALVKCSKPHQLTTAAVLPLPSTTSKIESEQGQINEYVYGPAQQACSTYIQKNLGGPDDQNGRFEFKVYLPAEADWAAGARWVRCDLTVFKVGSLVAAPELENLPSFATLKHQIKSDSHQFDLCTRSPGGIVASGPRAVGAVFAACDGNAQWTFFHYFGDNAPNPGYPTPAEFKAQFEHLCTQFGVASGAHTVPWYPTPKQWADGTHGFECWGTSK